MTDKNKMWVTPIPKSLSDEAIFFGGTHTSRVCSAVDNMISVQVPKSDTDKMTITAVKPRNTVSKLEGCTAGIGPRDFPTIVWPFPSNEIGKADPMGSVPYIGTPETWGTADRRTIKVSGVPYEVELPDVAAVPKYLLKPNNATVTLQPDSVDTEITPADIAERAKNLVANSNTAIRYNEGKLDWGMLPIDSLEEIMKVLEFGKIKYSRWNWSKGKGFTYTSVASSLLRHVFAWMKGEDKDPESGLHHLAHAGCNIFFLLHFIINKDKYPAENDDRYKA